MYEHWKFLEKPGIFHCKKMANLEHPILEFVSGSQKITLSTSKEGICVSVVSRNRKHILRCAIWMGPGLPGTWAGAHYKHVHKPLCIWLYVAFISCIICQAHVWNRSTSAWNPVGGKAVYCHWCIVIHQASMGTRLLPWESHP